MQYLQPASVDTVSLCQLWKNDKVREFLGGAVSHENVNKKIISLQNHWNQHGFGQWAVYSKDKQLTGISGLHYSEDGVELSYMFFPLFWGQGWAREAALASLDFGFNILRLETIIAITQEANQKSCLLLEKIGMIHVDNLRRFNTDQRLYKINLTEWLINKGASTYTSLDCTPPL